mgnify:CR=1 FL=1
MGERQDAVQVMTTVDDEEAAHRIAEHTIQERLAACAQVLGPIRSRFHWQGEVADEEEWLVIFKSLRSIYDDLERAILKVHSYDVPEILAVPIVAGYGPYLDWLAEETSS